MADFTKVNLDKVQDVAKDGGFEGNHEARFPSKELGLTESGLGYEIIYPGKHMPFGHTHNKQEEVYVIISGKGQLKVGDETIDVQAMDAIRVAAATDRAFKADDNEKLILIVFGAPKTQEQDASMQPDPWTDK